MRALTAARAIAARVGSRLVTSPTSHEPPLVLVFSKDRAIQLELFLRSYAQHMSTPLPLSVMYRASTEAHRQAYEEVFASYRASELSVVAETAFKPDLLEVLMTSNARHVIFFVDDLAFIQPVDTRLMEQWDPRDGILSLRLGRNITHSHHRGGIAQPQPASFESATRGEQPLARWRWSTGTLDWALPTALDGHLLPLPDLVPVVEQASFVAPDSLEEAIGQYKFLFKWRWGYCWEQARIVNLRQGTMGLDAGQLLAAFQQGLRLDISELPLAGHNSCHMAWAPALRRLAETSGAAA
ncbi:MAG: hypothetical protein JSS56_19020 [Proteobacteria bacterium]|nr:hypothetical protein [Pseudomonadota bacterium]